MNIFGINITRSKLEKDKTPIKRKPKVEAKKPTAPPPGRVSVPNDGSMSLITSIKGMTSVVTPSFRVESIPEIRDLYKVNPDISITVQDTFKLANTDHSFTFPYNEDDEAKEMEIHLSEVSKTWSNYTSGIHGLINRFIVQCLVSGSISMEAVPKRDLSGIATIVLVNPEDIIFKRLGNGVYHPYQINKTWGSVKDTHIKLNLLTYKYIGVYNDTDEPYGIPPFLAALEPLLVQKDMKKNFAHMMGLAGLLGFLEALVEKPSKLANESEPAYQRRLENYLIKVKNNLINGMGDGVVVGFEEDHAFKMNSTTKDLSNLDKLWNMNQQELANGLGSNGSTIGVSISNTEGGTGIILSKLISQLKNMQVQLCHILEFIYSLELRLAGFNCKGIKVKFNTSTISDEVKVQQGLEYKIRNLQALYKQGIISQYQFALEMGYDEPSEDEPLPEPGLDDDDPLATSAKKKARKDDKNKSDRRGTDKSKVAPKRQDQKTKPR